MLARPNEEIRIGGLEIRFRLEGEESGGSVAVFEFDVPAGARVPASHSHDAFDETIYRLEGVLGRVRRNVVLGGRHRCAANKPKREGDKPS
jgi:hypothetical protein